VRSPDGGISPPWLVLEGVPDGGHALERMKTGGGALHQLVVGSWLLVVWLLTKAEWRKLLA
jgi:hypothetical protein